MKKDLKSHALAIQCIQVGDYFLKLVTETGLISLYVKGVQKLVDKQCGGSTVLSLESLSLSPPPPCLWIQETAGA